MTRRPLAVLCTGVTTAALTLSAGSLTAGSAQAATPHRTGSFVLTATDRTSPTYSPTFTGNGYLGVRVPPAGQGFAGGTVPAQSEVAGFYADPAGTGPKDVQQRANLPSWSGLALAVDGHTYSLRTGTVSRWRQQLDLRTGVITTRLRWTAPGGKVADLRYDVSTDRARQYVGLVRLQVTPHWTGTAAVVDLVDGTPATLTTQAGKGWSAVTGSAWETVKAVGTGIRASVATRVTVAPRAAGGRPTPVGATVWQSVGQRIPLTVKAGRHYTVTKYVGVVTSQDARDPLGAARRQADAAARAGWTRLQRANDAAWARLWAGRIDVAGNPHLATEVNASEFYLWSSTRDGVDWSISPAGLSSNGYDGHVFWDAETWMYPSLLAQHPELAAGMNAYRYQRLAAAKAHARATGAKGARFPWESALDGTEQIPPPVSVNSEGLYEVHITADVALAQWQYYQATGSVSWLRRQGWPVIKAAATYWASRVTRAADGSYHLLHVTDPDEENPDVTDGAFTIAGAATTLRNAVNAARVLHTAVPSSWRTIAAHLVVPVDPATNTHPEFAGYQGQLVKQADVTMLQYPWAYPMSDATATADLNYYVPRSDPMGPSMTDAISSIDVSSLGTQGCSAYTFTRRSVDPFIRDGFDQFSETSTGGAFTFMTGIGGFLQEFLYGYSGLRWGGAGVVLDPTLSGGMTGVTLHDLRWHGRTFTVDVGATATTISLQRGAPMKVSIAGVQHVLQARHPISLPTRRPDLAPTTDALRCAPVTASSAQPLGPALGAVDGSPATDWQPAHIASTLTVALPQARTLSSVTALWGQRWPEPPKTPNTPPPPGPVLTLRASSYDLLGSTDGTHWTTLASVRGRTDGLTDTLSFPPTSVRWLRLQVLDATNGQPPKLQELTAG